MNKQERIWVERDNKYIIQKNDLIVGKSKILRNKWK